MQQKVVKKCNYVALLIRRFAFSKLVESVYEYILSGFKNKYSAWIINSGCGIYFLLVWQDQNTKRNQFFNKLFYTTRCTLGCAILCCVLNFVVQLYLMARENEFHVLALCKCCKEHFIKVQIVGALISFHFNVFLKKRFDMLANASDRL